MGESYLDKANSGLSNAGRRIALQFQLLHEMRVTAAKLGSSREWLFSQAVQQLQLVPLDRFHLNSIYSTFMSILFILNVKLGL